MPRTTCLARMTGGRVRRGPQQRVHRSPAIRGAHVASQPQRRDRVHRAPRQPQRHGAGVAAGRQSRRPAGGGGGAGFRRQQSGTGSACPCEQRAGSGAGSSQQPHASGARTAATTATAVAAAGRESAGDQPRRRRVAHPRVWILWLIFEPLRADLHRSHTRARLSRLHKRAGSRLLPVAGFGLQML